MLRVGRGSVRAGAGVVLALPGASPYPKTPIGAKPVLVSCWRPHESPFVKAGRAT